MGGRGAYAGSDNSQINMRKHLDRQEIMQIRDRGEDIRAKSKAMATEGVVAGAGNGASRQTMKKRCRCCLQYTLPAYSEYEICPVCGWIDDPRQNKDPSLTEGSNPISLNEARKSWQEQNT